MIYFKKYFDILLLFVVFTSCQTGSIEEVYSTKETIAKTTPLATFVQRIVMQKTSQDNIIDKSSCFMIKFPYVVTVNYVQISINSASDYVLVQNNIDASSYDNDIVRIHFPITVILDDYSERSLSSQTAFNNLITECEANSNVFGKINCININFPITINVYDSNNQIASAISVTSNQLLFSFFENLENNKLIAISYPITITNSNGQNIVITNNSQFEDVIKNAVDTCLDTTTAALDFVQIVTSGSWKITYYYHDGEKTSVYDGYTFTFDSNYKVIATKLGVSYNGIWSTKVYNGVREFGIKFESDLLGKLDEGWKEFEFNNSQLRFRDVEETNDNDYLYFEKK